MYLVDLCETFTVQYEFATLMPIIYHENSRHWVNYSKTFHLLGELDIKDNTEFHKLYTRMEESLYFPARAMLPQILGEADELPTSLVDCHRYSNPAFLVVKYGYMPLQFL